MERRLTKLWWNSRGAYTVISHPGILTQFLLSLQAVEVNPVILLVRMLYQFRCTGTARRGIIIQPTLPYPNLVQIIFNTSKTVVGCNLAKFHQLSSSCCHPAGLQDPVSLAYLILALFHSLSKGRRDSSSMEWNAALFSLNWDKWPFRDTVPSMDVLCEKGDCLLVWIAIRGSFSFVPVSSGRNLEFCCVRSDKKLCLWGWVDRSKDL